MASAVENTLNKFGKRVTKLARINLGSRQNGKVIDSSGNLRKSLDYEVEVFKSGNFSFNISMEDYGVYVDKGRKKGKGTPWSKDKGFYVIKKWIKTKPLRLRDYSKGVSPTGRKFIQKKETAINSAAFLINRKIKEKGIKATNFISEPFEKEFKKLSNDLVKSFDLDIDKFLETSLNGNISK